MASRLLRRSGMAFALVAEMLEWQADIVIQVGVGLNHQEVDVLKEEWPDASFYGFEPHPDSFKTIVKKYPGRLFDCALGSVKGTTTLYGARSHKDGFSIHPPKLQLAGQLGTLVTVRVETLDGMFQEPLNGRTLLWLDCEGAEFDVIYGGLKVLQQVEMINVEMTANPNREGWCKPSAVHKALVGWGFRRQWVHSGRISAGQYDAVYVRPHLYKSQYSCDPWE